MREDFSVALADFGESQFYDSKNPSDNFAGTPYYVAPEILKMEGNL